MSNELVGQSKYGEERVQKNSFKLLEGDKNIFRVLPPFGSLRNKGLWKVYESVHWGYGVTRDGKFRHRPFKCLAERDYNGKVTQKCPACEHIIQLKLSLDSAKEKYKDRSRDEQEELTRPLADALKKFNLDKKWHMNVLSLDGKIGRLMIGHKAKLALDVEIKKMRASGECMDPVGVGQGPFWTFAKIKGASFQDTMHTVVPFTETEIINGKRMQSVKYQELTEDVIERMQTEAFDLGELYIRLNLEDCQRLVESGGDPDISNAIFLKREKVPEETETKAPAAIAGVAKSAEQTEEERLQAQLDALRRKKAVQASSLFTKEELDEDDSPVSVKDADFARVFGKK